VGYQWPLFDVFRALLDRFHPAIRRVKEIVDSGELGTPTKIEASFVLPTGFVKDNDIRMVYDLGGGALMDLGCASDCELSHGTHDIIPHRLHTIRVAVHSRC
jgi:hypothetical protein